MNTAVRLAVGVLTIAALGTACISDCDGGPPGGAVRASAAATPPVAAGADSQQIVGRIDVAPVWAGHPVGFALLTRGERQYAAFYAADRHLTVTARNLASDQWELFRLPSERAEPPSGPKQTSAVVGWDSHNSIVMAADSAGHLHLAGNMHGNALTYWRTREPGTIASFEQVQQMVGRDEDRCTYPVFLTLADGRLVFQYRSGKSGDGSTFLNVYDVASRSWKRLVDGPVFDGEKQRNAYPLAPVAGPDGMFHLSWVWRESPDASTNHDLSYARSRDLAHWEDAAGRPLALPIRLATEGVIVDPVPVNGGILNGSGRVGFDSQKRPVLAYYKFDAAGRSQAYVARWEGSTWHVVQLSDWDHRFELAGAGTLPKYDVRVGAVRPGKAGELQLEFGHVKKGSGVWVLEEGSLAVLRTEPATPPYPRSLWKVESTFPGMTARFADDSGASGKPGRRFVLRWEAIEPNRDKPRPEPWPEPSMLRVVEIGMETVSDPVSDPLTPYLDGNAPGIVRELPPVADAPANVMVRRVVFRSRDDSEIFAVIAAPKTPGKHPGMLVLHGGGGSAEVDKAIAWAQRGYVAVAPDLPGIADPKKSLESKGKWSTGKYGDGRWVATPDASASVIFDAVLSAMKSLYLVRSHPEVDPERIGVVGVSWGGYMTTMVCGLAGDQVRAGFAVFGCGFYDRTAQLNGPKSTLGALSEEERERWLRHLDAGRRAPKMTAAFFIAGAANDFFYWPQAVQATLDAIPSEKNHLFAPNANHEIPLPGGTVFPKQSAEPFTPTVFQPYPTPSGGKANWLAMEVPFFEFHLKGVGDPLPKVQVEKTDSPRVARFTVAAPRTLSQVAVYWAKADPDVIKREWFCSQPVNTGADVFEATLPEEAVDWFAVVSDERPVTVSGDLMHVQHGSGRSGQNSGHKDKPANATSTSD